MSHLRLARISLILAAAGLQAAPALMQSAHAQGKFKTSETNTVAAPQMKNLDSGKKEQEAAAAAATAAAPAKGNTVRPEIYKHIDPKVINELLAAKNFTQIQANLTSAEAVPNRTPYEDYILSYTRFRLAATQNDSPATIQHMEALIASPFFDKADLPKFVQSLGNLYYEAKNYPKAIELLKRYQTLSPTATDAAPILIRSYYLMGDYATAKAELIPIIDAEEKAGRVPGKVELGMLHGIGVKMKDTELAAGAIEKLAKYHPTDEYWTDMINSIMRKKTFDERLVLDVLRLKQTAVKTMAPEEYAEMAEMAMRGGYFVEAKKAVDAGYDAGVLGKDSNKAQHKTLRDRATKGAADDAKTIAAGEAGAAKAKDGQPLVNLGYAYVTMDQFDKGIDLIQKGIAKGVKRPEDAKLRLGVAYAKAGRKDEAIKAFSEVKGDSGVNDLAKYWTMLLNRAPMVASADTAAPAK
ncbi:MAG: tetratricopeptide repeat protein [Pseudomonadota bacterium]